MAEDTKKTILIVEDEPDNLFAMSTSFEDDFNVLQAENLETAADYLSMLESIDLIVMDGYVEPGSTLDLIAEIRARGYSKPIIAASNTQEMRDRQMAAGCSHDVGGLKANAIKIVFALLTQQEQEVL